MDVLLNDRRPNVVKLVVDREIREVAKMQVRPDGGAKQRIAKGETGSSRGEPRSWSIQRPPLWARG